LIIVTLIGGLGNQMFQYAAGRALALRRGVALELDDGWLRKTQPNVIARTYELDCFPIDAKVRTVYPRTRVRRVCEFLHLAPPVWREQQDYRFDPRTLDLPGRIRLVGYWPSERYFADQEAQIRRDFELAEPSDERNQATAQKIQGTNAVAIHVRRGDYVDNPSTKSFHGLLSLDYYRTAVNRIIEEVRDPHFFVFSDDPDWCRNNLEVGTETTYVDQNGGRGASDLWLMSQCKHNIIANSSFSWWGAWLNRGREKIVIAPARWVADPSTDTSDVIPAGWIRL